MKRFTAIAAVLAVFISGQQVLAQNAVSGSASQSYNTANQVSASGAIASGGNVIYNEAPQPSQVTTRQDGTARARIENAPALGGLALGGGHPCAWSPATAQISIIGGAFGAGGMTIDEACMLMVMGASTGDTKAYNAAIYMMAARDFEACVAMYKSGLVTDCVDRNGKSRVKPKPTPVVSTRNKPADFVALKVECREVGNTIQPVVSREVMDTYGAAKIKAACK